MCVFSGFRIVVRFFAQPIRAVAPRPYPEFRGCFITHLSDIEFVDFFSLTVLDGGMWRFSCRRYLQLTLP